MTVYYIKHHSYMYINIIARYIATYIHTESLNFTIDSMYMLNITIIHTTKYHTLPYISLATLHT